MAITGCLMSLSGIHEFNRDRRCIYCGLLEREAVAMYDPPYGVPLRPNNLLQQIQHGYTSVSGIPRTSYASGYANYVYYNKEGTEPQLVITETNDEDNCTIILEKEE